MSWADFKFTRRLAQDPDVRANSFDQRPPTFWGHVRWMCRWLFALDRHAWLVTENGRRLGLVRAAIGSDGNAEVGIAMLPEGRGRRLAADALRIICWRLDGWGIWCVRARIKFSNLPSIRAFDAAGFRAVGGERGDLLIMEWRRQWPRSERHD